MQLPDYISVAEVQRVCRELGLRDWTQLPDPPAVTEAEAQKILDLINDPGGVRILISRRKCALVKSREEKAAYRMRVDPEKCLGEACGCARICTRIFKCPGLIWNKEKGKN